MADFLHHFIDQLVAAVAARLAPKFEGFIHQIEALAHQVEGVRGDVGKLSAKVDKLGTGGVTPAQLAQITDATMGLRTSAGTLKAAVESITP